MQIYLRFSEREYLRTQFKSTNSSILILVFPSILFHHFLKFSKLLQPLHSHLPSIQKLSIRLQPIEHIMLLGSVFRRIMMISFNKSLHFIEPTLPSFVLRHRLLKIIHHINCISTTSYSDITAFSEHLVTEPPGQFGRPDT